MLSLLYKLDSKSIFRLFELVIHMALNTGQWIVFFSLCLLYLVFLFYDAFKRGEKYGNIAYLAAIIPSIYMWHVMTLPVHGTLYDGWGASGGWLILTGLWSITMIRDIILVLKKEKDIDDVALWLGIAFIIQLIASAILPISIFLPHMQDTTNLVMQFLYMPDVFNADMIVLWLIRIFATFLVIGLIVPMIRDFKGQPINMFALLMVTLLISAPFALISYLWLPEYWYALLSAFAVLFFIMMLLLTRGGDQRKKMRPPIKRPSTRPPKPEEKKEEESKEQKDSSSVS